MCIRSIRNEADYELAVKTIDTLWQAPEGSYNEERVQILKELISAYEKKHYLIDFPDSVGALNFYMQKGEISFETFAKVIGSEELAHDLLNRKAPFTVPIIRALYESFGWPPLPFIAP